MRIERDFGYAGRVRDSLDAPPFVVPEMRDLAQRLGGRYRERLVPTLSLTNTATRWTFSARQGSLDGKTHLSLKLSGDARRSQATLANRVLTVRALTNEPLEIRVEIQTYAPALTPLTRQAIFNSAFLRFNSCWMATAHCTASTALANSASRLSPGESTTRPRCCWMSVVITSR